MNRHKNYGIALLAGALLLTGFASNALALGTAACSSVSNTATLQYAVGGINQTNITSAAATFDIAAKVDLSVIAVNSAATATGANQVLTFRIRNTGNDTQSYGLKLYYVAASSDFPMDNVEVYTDTDSTYGSGGTQTTIDNTAAATDGTLLGVTADVPANGDIFVHVVSDVPVGQASGDEAHYTLKAITYQAGGTLETADTDEDAAVVTSCSSPVVEADGDADGAGTDDAANDGDYLATGNYVVSAANLSVTKSYAVLWDPYNGNSANRAAIPGAYVQYTITVSNGVGAATANLNQITDALAGSLGIDPNLFTGADLTPADGPYESAAGSGFKVTHTAAGRSTLSPRYFTTTSSADGVDFAGNTITASFNLVLPDETPGTTYTAGELRGGESVILTFNAIIQ